MAKQGLRIGVIGAGQNSRDKHIPGLQAIKGVEIAGVVNRRKSSSREVAKAFDIPKVYKDWKELVSDKEIDAVVIGTWPYLHCDATIESLRSGKHVLCEARMAMDATEARAMFETSRAFPHLVTQVVPSPIGLFADYWVREQLNAERLGRINEVVIRHVTGAFADPSTPHTWRTEKEFSGVNVMSLGIFAETIFRWLGFPASVMASARQYTQHRVDSETGRMRAVEMPESVTVCADLVSGAHVIFQIMNVAHHGHTNRIEIHGSRGTVRIDPDRGRIAFADSNDSMLKPVRIPKTKQREWSVEADFVRAIRGEAPVGLATFEEGVRYMEFTEAVHLSAMEGKRIALRGRPA